MHQQNGPCITGICVEIVWNIANMGAKTPQPSQKLPDKGSGTTI